MMVVIINIITTTIVIIVIENVVVIAIQNLLHHKTEFQIISVVWVLISTITDPFRTIKHGYININSH